MFLKFNSNVCRVCLEEQEGNISIYKKNGIADQFRFCTLLEVSIKPKPVIVSLTNL